MSDEIKSIIKGIDMSEESTLKIFEEMVSLVLAGFKARGTNKFIVQYFEKGVDKIRQLIKEAQQKPKIDEKYVEEKLRKLEYMFLEHGISRATEQGRKDFITQIIRDVQGVVDGVFIKKWKKKFHDSIDAIKLYEEMSFGERIDVGFDMLGDERTRQLSKLIPEMLIEAGVKIKK